MRDFSPADVRRVQSKWFEPLYLRVCAFYSSKGYRLNQTATDLTKTAFDPELSPGAYNAVNTCLRIQPSEKVTVITDNDTREIAASIVHELIAVGSPFKAFVLEDLAPRPLTELPAEIAEDMETSQVSIFAVRVQRNELKSRMQMTDIVNRRRMRHAHMVNINRQIMLEGMRADFNHGRRSQPQGDGHRHPSRRRSSPRIPRAPTSPPT